MAALDITGTFEAAEAPRGPPAHLGSCGQVAFVAWPLVVAMLSHTVMGLCDTVMVSRLGTRAVAAVGIGSTACFVVTCLALGLLGGVRIVVAQASGRGDSARARRVALQGLAVAGVLGAALVIAILPLAEPLLRLLCGGEELAELAGAYFSARLPGSVAALVGTVCLGWFEGHGDTRRPMRVRVAANVTNLVLDYALVFGAGPFPALGVAGAGHAASIALMFEAAAALVMFLGFSRASFARSEAACPRHSWDGLSELLRVGSPIGAQWALESLCWALFTALVARAGEEHLAAQVLVLQICALSFLPGQALADSACILTGRARGAGDPHGAERTARAAALLAVAVMGAAGLVFLCFPAVVLAPFSPDPAVARIAASLLALAAAAQLFDALAMTYSGALAGVGDTRTVMLVCGATGWAQLVPMAWLLCGNLGLGAPGAWIALLVESMLLAAVMRARWRAALVARPLWSGSDACACAA